MYSIYASKCNLHINFKTEKNLVQSTHNCDHIYLEYAEAMQHLHVILTPVTSIKVKKITRRLQGLCDTLYTESLFFVFFVFTIPNSMTFTVISLCEELQSVVHNFMVLQVNLP
jgi:hypothetical protein